VGSKQKYNGVLTSWFGSFENYTNHNTGVHTIIIPCFKVPQGVLLTKGKKLTKMDLTQEEIPTRSMKLQRNLHNNN
jgi:hypothetical protein